MNEVTQEEVIACAKAGCRFCLGTGMVVRQMHTGKNFQRISRACQCANKRFRKKHGEGVEVTGDVMHWKADHGL